MMVFNVLKDNHDGLEDHHPGFCRWLRTKARASRVVTPRPVSRQTAACPATAGRRLAAPDGAGPDASRRGCTAAAGSSAPATADEGGPASVGGEESAAAGGRRLGCGRKRRTSGVAPGDGNSGAATPGQVCVGPLASVSSTCLGDSPPLLAAPAKTPQASQGDPRHVAKVGPGVRARRLLEAMSASNSLGDDRSRRTRKRARPMSSPAWWIWYAASSGASWCALHQARTSASASGCSGEGSNHSSPLRASGVGKSGSPCGPWHAASPKSRTFWCRTFRWLISPQSVPPRVSC